VLGDRGEATVEGRGRTATAGGGFEISAAPTIAKISSAQCFTTPGAISGIA